MIRDLTRGDSLLRRIREAMVWGVVVALAACGDETTTEPEDSLTEEEALALIEVAIGQGIAVSGQVTGGTEVVTPEGVTLDFTAPCSMGGTVAVNAQAGFTGDPNAESAGVDLSVTLVHSGCVEAQQGSGITFTLDGAPNVNMNIELTIGAEFGFTLSGTVAGMVAWTTGDGRAGTCALDVRLEPVDDPNALLSVMVTGQACGTQIMESISAGGFLS